MMGNTRLPRPPRLRGMCNRCAVRGLRDDGPEFKLVQVYFNLKISRIRGSLQTLGKVAMVVFVIG